MIIKKIKGLTVTALFSVCFFELNAAERLLMIPATRHPGREVYLRDFTNEFAHLIHANRRFTCVSRDIYKKNKNMIFPTAVDPVKTDLTLMAAAVLSAKIIYLYFYETNQMTGNLIFAYDSQRKKNFYYTKKPTELRAVSFAREVYTSFNQTLIRKQTYINMLKTMKLSKQQIYEIESCGGTIYGALKLFKRRVSIDHYRLILLAGGNASDFLDFLNKNYSLNDYLFYLKQIYRPFIKD